MIEGVLVPWMLMHYGWRTSFHVRRVRRAAVADALVPAHADGLRLQTGHAGAPSRRRGFIAAVVTLVTNRNLLGICLGFFCFDYYWYFLVNWLPDYLVTVARPDDS